MASKKQESSSAYTGKKRKAAKKKKNKHEKKQPVTKKPSRIVVPGSVGCVCRMEDNKEYVLEECHWHQYLRRRYPAVAEKTIAYKREVKRITEPFRNTTISLEMFKNDPLVADPSKLSGKQRLEIVEQAIVLFEEIYVHRPLKEASYGVNPIRQLNLLRNSLLVSLEKGVNDVSHHPLTSTPLEKGMDDVSHHPLTSTPLEFHRMMIDIFVSVRDLHTNYLTPPPFDTRTAFIPVLIEEVVDSKSTERKYFISRVTPGMELPILRAVFQRMSTEEFDLELVKNIYSAATGESVEEKISGELAFEKAQKVFWSDQKVDDEKLIAAMKVVVGSGIEVASWNFVPVHRAVEINGDRFGGSNLEARRARGISTLTVRPLFLARVPDENQVLVHFNTGLGKHEIKFDWLVANTDEFAAIQNRKSF